MQNKINYIYIKNIATLNDFEQKVEYIEELNKKIKKEEENKIILNHFDIDFILLLEEMLDIQAELILLKEIEKTTTIEEIRELFEKLNELNINKIILGIKDIEQDTEINYKKITKVFSEDIIKLLLEEEKNNILNNIQIIPIENWITYLYTVSLLKYLNKNDKIEEFKKTLDYPEELKIIYNKEKEKLDIIEKVKLELLEELEKILNIEKFKKIFDEYISNSMKIVKTEPND